MNFDEVEELACLMLGKDYDSIVDNYYTESIAEMFYNVYEVDIDSFYRIVKDLIKFTPTWKSPITGELYQGFVVPENNMRLMRAVIKEKCKYDTTSTKFN